MRRLTLVPPAAQKPKPDYAAIYERIYFQTLETFDDTLSKLVLSGVRMMNKLKAKNPEATLDPHALFAMYQTIANYIALLTPAELMRVFPITKDYDGARYGFKDYFFTMDALRKHGMRNTIGDAVIDILWDYTNMELKRFLVGLLGAINDVRRINGEKGLAEEFFGLTLHVLHTDSITGKQYLQNSDTGEVMPVTKKSRDT